jgi:hypothetical protein
MSKQTEALRKAQGALRMTLMLRQLGGMLPGTHEVVQAAVDAAQEVFPDIAMALSEEAQPVAWIDDDGEAISDAKKRRMTTDGSASARSAAAYNRPAFLYAQPVPALPEGWVAVPREPTREMLEQANTARYDKHDSLGNVYAAMIAAAPPMETRTPP